MEVGWGGRVGGGWWFSDQIGGGKGHDAKKPLWVWRGGGDIYVR